MCALMDVSENEDSQDQKIEHVVKRLWKYAQTYSIGTFYFTLKSQITYSHSLKQVIPI